MRVIVLLAGMCLGSLLMAGASEGAPAASLSAEQRQTLTKIRRDLSQVTHVIRRKKFDEAEQTLDKVEKQLKQIAKDSELPLSHPLLAGVAKALSLRRHQIAYAKDPKAAKEAENSVSFVKHVAPVLQSKCVECHADEPDGQLRLDTFAGIKRGGESGPLLVAGQPNHSLMMHRLLAPQKHRMPLKAKSLSRNEVTMLALWIGQGAKFDGDDETQVLSDLLNPAKDAPPIKFAAPTGSETVSFKNDIAPFLVEDCLRCHQGRKPSGGFLLEDFESLLKGSDSGLVIVPGKPDKSLLYQLLGNYDDDLRMPLEGKIKRSNYDDMRTWIAEGARYDGGDPRLHLRALNPTQSEVRAAELAAFNPEDFDRYREQHTAAQWKDALPGSQPRTLKTRDVLYYGDVSQKRLEEVKEWAETHLDTLRTLFAAPEDRQLWKGRLTLYVIDQRATFETFNQEVALRRVFDDNFGTSNVTPALEEAFIILHDTGDKAADDVPTLHFNLVEQLTAAWLSASKSTAPEWLTLGLGPALAAKDADKRDPHLEELRGIAIESLEDLENAADVFQDGIFFSADQTRPVGYALTAYLLKRGGDKQLADLIKTIDEGASVENAIRTAYSAEPELVARSFLSTMKPRRKRK